MSREKEGYREILSVLMEKYPALLTNSQTAEVLGCSPRHVYDVIKRGHLKVKDGKIPIGAIASYLCAD